MTTLEDPGSGLAPTPLPNLAFLGTGWIGRNRLEALHRTGAAVIASVCDADRQAAEDTASAVGAAVDDDLDTILERDDIDGVVIATPSALHASQAQACLRRGLAVFCQKPLGCTTSDVRATVKTARDADRLLGVDMSYRKTAAAEAVASVIASGELGEVYAGRLVFHNAYGPDKAWFMDPALAGGGCVMDLGIHLVDLARCVLGERRFTDIDAALFNRGRRVLHSANEPEDHALVTLQNDGCTLQLACSWFLDAGRDAVIEATFYGTKAAVSFHNVDGSFYDFEATLMKGTTSKTLVEPPDDWGGRTLVDWATRLAVSPEFDEAVEEHVTLAATIDRIYGRFP